MTLTVTVPSYQSTSKARWCSSPRPPWNYEDKREYRVTVTATDPSGELDSVDVIVNITNVNEGPEWVTTPPTSPG